MRDPAQAGPRDVARLLLPAFLGSTLVILIGIGLFVEHHRTVGVVIVGIGVIGGFGLRAWLMLRDQQRRRLVAERSDPPAYG